MREPDHLPPGANPYERHVLVCTTGKACPDEGGVEVHQALKLEARRVLGPLVVRVNKAGCVAQCGHGPMVIVYPEGVWYAGVAVEDVPELVEEHLVHGRVVERLLFRGHVRGKNIAPAADGAAAGAMFSPGRGDTVSWMTF